MELTLHTLTSCMCDGVNVTSRSFICVYMCDVCEGGKSVCLCVNLCVRVCVCMCARNMCARAPR
jgi:hypothetical protein